MLLIKNVKVNGEITNILINGNQVSDISKNINEMMDVPCLDGKGRTILPAFVDIHTHLREPGFEARKILQLDLWQLSVVDIVQFVLCQTQIL